MSFRFHSQRSNYVTCLSRYGNKMILDLDNPALHVWNEGISIKWESQCILSYVTGFLYPSNTDDVTVSVEADEDSEGIIFGYEESYVVEGMEYQSRNEI